MRLASWLGLAVLGACLAERPAAAHQFAPALLELEERADADRPGLPGLPGLIDVAWKQPAVRVMGSRLRPVLPVECTGDGDPVVKLEGTGMRATWRIRCPGGLAGKTVGVDGIASSQADVLLRITLRDGRRLQSVLKAASPAYEIRAGAGRLGVLRDYGMLGLRHIGTGWDHLLFVLGLVLLVGYGRRLLLTITAFTAGHSVTLALATLGIVRIPPRPIEAAIALSIYFLAVELMRREAGRDTITARAPWLVAGTFGLLHGLGFAGALHEVGLPSAEIPLALFSFNVGIEIGQLLFVAAVLLAGAALRRLPLPRWSLRRALPAYVIGGLAIFWFLERILPGG